MHGDGGAAERVGGSAGGGEDRPAANAAGGSGGGSAVRRGGRPPKRTGKGGGEVRRVQWTVSADLRRHLGVHCAITEESENDVVEKALAAYLQRYGKTTLPALGRAAEQSPPVEPVQLAAPATVQLAARPIPGQPADWKAELGARAAARRAAGVVPDTPEDRQDKRAG